MSAQRSEDRGRRVRRTTMLMTGIALLFYFGYIAMKLYRRYQ